MGISDKMEVTTISIDDATILELKAMFALPFVEVGAFPSFTTWWQRNVPKIVLHNMICEDFTRKTNDLMENVTV